MMPFLVIMQTNLHLLFCTMVRKLNYELMNLASQHADLHICDLSSVQNLYGRNNLFHASVYVTTEMTVSIETLPAMAQRTVDLLCAMYGRIKKCLVLDLDNTMWGGIIGDDGLENIQLGSLGIGKAFTEFQYWLKKLKDRGIILVVCSKNTESIAREVFEKHPDMILRMDDIAVFLANWENKTDNIRQIQKTLNIGFDSMVFLDDNPFERNFVKESIPGIVVPDLPEDPADFLEYLYSLNLFETTSLSEEDRIRTERYQTEAKRNTLQNAFVSEDEFLQNLHMISKVEGFTKFNVPRLRSYHNAPNQFNLRTVRYSEDDIRDLATAENAFPFTFTLSDKFGEHGLICVVILTKEDDKTLFIDTWFMSCRVLKRGMEQFVCNTITTFARKNGFEFIKGEYIPTAKNELVKDHYHNLGFSPQGNYWVLDTREIFSVLSSHYKTYTTQGNLNNHIGVPLTLLSVRADAEMAVIEMGANHQKEIEGYCVYTQPTHGVITNVGKAHLEGFGGIEGVRKGKGELFDYLSAHNGTAFVYADYDYLQDMSKNVKHIVKYGQSEGFVQGNILSNEPFLQVGITTGLQHVSSIQSQLVGDYNLPNILCATMIGKYFLCLKKK
jgi:FkbH-like protein